MEFLYLFERFVNILCQYRDSDSDIQSSKKTTFDLRSKECDFIVFEINKKYFLPMLVLLYITAHVLQNAQTY